MKMLELLELLGDLLLLAGCGRNRCRALRNQLIVTLLPASLHLVQLGLQRTRRVLRLQLRQPLSQLVPLRHDSARRGELLAQSIDVYLAAGRLGESTQVDT